MTLARAEVNGPCDRPPSASGNGYRDIWGRSIYRILKQNNIRDQGRTA